MSAAPSDHRERGVLGEVMEREIAEQPTVLRRLASEEAIFAEVADIVRRYRPTNVRFIARGSSANAALYGVYLAEIVLGLPAELMRPSIVTIYRTHLRCSGTLAIAVSQSGESPDIVESLQAARTEGALTIAITNAGHSPLAQVADHHIALNVGPELAVAATKSYTAELLALYLLLDQLRSPQPRGIGNLHEAAAAATDDTVASSARLAGHLAEASNVVTISRGYNLATAREAALKIMETSHQPVQAYSAADFMHGPIAAVDSSTTLLAITGHDAAARTLGDTLGRLGESGARLELIGPAIAGIPNTLASPHVTVEELGPVVDIIPLQRVALERARLAGLDPAKPRYLNKVTRTR